MAITVRLYRNYYPGTSPSFSRYYESLEEATKAGKEKLVKLNQYECWIYEYHFTGLMTKAFISALLNKGEPAKRILIKKILFEKAAPKPAPKSPEEILGVSKMSDDDLHSFTTHHLQSHLHAENEIDSKYHDKMNDIGRVELKKRGKDPDAEPNYDDKWGM